MEVFDFSDLKAEDLTDIVDVCDGLNASLRRLLLALGNVLPDDRFSNSSRILKNVLRINENEFEDVYDLLINTAWPRSVVPFIRGLGNFGFPPAYPDYTEMKLSGFGRTIVGRADSSDINQPFTVPVQYAFTCGTVSFTRGKTKIPSHNLSEVIDAMIALIKNPDLKTKDLLEFIKGPDLFVGGAIENSEELPEIYENGYGTIKIILNLQNFNRYMLHQRSHYCDWYELKYEKLSKNKAYRIHVPYYALMRDGEAVELMSLDKILKKHLDFYREYRKDLNDGELCDVLAELKPEVPSRLTREKIILK